MSFLGRSAGKNAGKKDGQVFSRFLPSVQIFIIIDSAQIVTLA
jgi:hypothetical protein